MVNATVTVNLEPLKRFACVIADDLRRSGTGPIRDALRQWAVRYRSAMQERFVEQSRGGGEWPPLKEITKQRRRGTQQGPRKKRGKRGSEHAATGTFAILRDTGTLFNALSPAFSGKPGQLQEDIEFGVRVGYGGPMRYEKGKAPATIADIARFHQTGAGRLPIRKILVDPPASCLAGMVADMERAIERVKKDTDS